ncbi:TetR/AcrR family transcriptional regulator [Leifsonia aquatica]|uniref:TetR/AcrR family transcriptional regulator n=1 Tax=Leifsonia aquatica TaxID=144185 RepID=UPI000694FBFC|nr:TetR/AcrR family transcriptional regulator [Leifsonia aquatica]
MSEPVPRRRGPYAKTAALRQQIVDEAHRVFAVHGYHGGSLREIAGAVGISLGNLQHHFSSKEELLVAVIARRDELGHGAVPHAPDESFDEHILAQAEHNETIPGLISLYSRLSAEAVSGDHPGHAHVLDRYDGLRAEYAAEFRALAAVGRLRAGVEPDLAAATVVALWEGIQLQWLYAPDRIDVPAALRAYLDLVIAPSPAPVRP